MEVKGFEGDWFLFYKIEGKIFMKYFANTWKIFGNFSKRNRLPLLFPHNKETESESRM